MEDGFVAVPAAEESRYNPDPFDPWSAVTPNAALQSAHELLSRVDPVHHAIKEKEASEQ